MLEDYFEFHHVIPRCMDGMDDPTNLVELMPEEHRTSIAGKNPIDGFNTAFRPNSA
jgi:hypothetical protein